MGEPFYTRGPVVWFPDQTGLKPACTQLPKHIFKSSGIRQQNQKLWLDCDVLALIYKKSVFSHDMAQISNPNEYI